MATHSSVLAWRVPGTEGPGGLLSTELHRVRHDWHDLESAAAFFYTVMSSPGGKISCLFFCNSWMMVYESSLWHTKKQPRCPSADEWIRKLWYIYTMEYYSAIKKNAFESVLMRWMKLEPIIQSEVSQNEKHQYSILTHIYGIYKDGNNDPICETAEGTQI